MPADHTPRPAVPCSLADHSQWLECLTIDNQTGGGIEARVRAALEHISSLYADTPGLIRPAAMSHMTRKEAARFICATALGIAPTTPEGRDDG